LENLKEEYSISAIYHKEQLVPNLYYRRSKVFLEACKKVFLYRLYGGSLSEIIFGVLEEKVGGIIFAPLVKITSAEYESKAIHPMHAKINLDGQLNRLTKLTAWFLFFSRKTSYLRLFCALNAKFYENFATCKKRRFLHCTRSPLSLRI
jgi:hypothetical protein